MELEEITVGDSISGKDLKELKEQGIIEVVSGFASNSIIIKDKGNRYLLERKAEEGAHIIGIENIEYNLYLKY